MRTTLATILFTAVLHSAVGQTVVDFYLDMEAGTNRQAITTNLLNSCTHTAPGVGYWTFNRGHPQFCTDCFAELTNVTDFVVLTTAGTNGVWGLRSPINVNGVTYDNATHTRVFGKGLNNRNQTAQFNFTTPHLRTSIGFYYTMAVGYSGQSIYILSTGLFNYANENSWDYDILGGTVVNNNASVFVHSHAGGPGGAGTINIKVAKTYWITQLWDGLNGVCKIEVYDPVTWAKIGNTSQLMLSNVPCEFFQFGDLQNTNDEFSVTNCFGNLIMDWTSATFPLLLPAAAQPALPFQITSIMRTNLNNLLIAWNTSGTSNIVQVTTDTGASGSYSTNDFTDLTNIVVTVTATNFLDVGAATNHSARYYRIRSPQ